MACRSCHPESESSEGHRGVVESLELAGDPTREMIRVSTNTVVVGCRNSGHTRNLLVLSGGVAIELSYSQLIARCFDW